MRWVRAPTACRRPGLLTLYIFVHPPTHKTAGLHCKFQSLAKPAQRARPSNRSGASRTAPRARRGAAVTFARTAQGQLTPGSAPASLAQRVRAGCHSPCSRWGRGRGPGVSLYWTTAWLQRLRGGRGTRALLPVVGISYLSPQNRARDSQSWHTHRPPRPACLPACRRC